MPGEIAAKRHAQAIFEIATQDDQLEKWRSDLDLMASVFGDPQLTTALEDPRIRYEDKASTVEKNIPELSQKALNLARLLILKRRVRLIKKIAEEYGVLMDRQKGIEHAEVTTAIEVDFSTEFRIKEELAKITGTSVEVSRRVDPEIIGGFIARVGDKVIDASVRNRLQRLKHNIIKQAV
ncbi:MAG: ATP synthase F1 subunit delta [Dehalococcoidia bacterium]